MPSLTKAQTLNSLKGLHQAKTLESLICSYEKWKQSPESFLNAAQEKNWPLFIVRSSATTEDQENYSNAGKYTSLLNVPLSSLNNAIETVFSSYGKNIPPKDEVLLQPMLLNVLRYRGS
jgi:hypothetical protein